MSDHTPPDGSDDESHEGTHADVTDGEYRAVLDRIEDGLATLVLEAEGESVGQVLVAPGRLPADARHADAILTVTLEDGRLTACHYEERATDQRREGMQSRFDRLARRREDAEGAIEEGSDSDSNDPPDE